MQDRFWVSFPEHRSVFRVNPDRRYRAPCGPGKTSGVVAEIRRIRHQSEFGRLAEDFKKRRSHFEEYRYRGCRRQRTY